MGSGQLVIGGFYDNMICRGINDPLLQVPPTGSMVNMTRSFYAISVDGVMTGDELLEGHAPEKKRRLTSDQVHLLERSFKVENKLEPQRRTQLAKELVLEPRQVSIWFQNRRARWKTKQIERDYDLLKSAYDSLISDYQGLIKEHEKLKSEVISLQEKLSANYMVDHKTCISSPDIISSLNLTCKEEDGLSIAGSIVADSLHPADCGNSGFLNYVSLEALQMVEGNAEKTCSANQWLCVDIGSFSYLTETAYAVEGEQFGCLCCRTNCSKFPAFQY